MKTRLAKQIEKNAAKDFAEHTITKRLDVEGRFRSYRCQKPGTWIYGFDVTFIPGSVILTGDIGGLILSRECDMLPWLRGVLKKNSIDFRYVAEKVDREISIEEWSEEVTRENLKYWLKDYAPRKLTRDEREELLDFGDQETFEVIVVPKLISLGFDDLWELGKHDYTARFYWQVFALRWFVQTLDSEQEETACA